MHIETELSSSRSSITQLTDMVKLVIKFVLMNQHFKMAMTIQNNFHLIDPKNRTIHHCEMGLQHQRPTLLGQARKQWLLKLAEYISIESLG